MHLFDVLYAGILVEIKQYNRTDSIVCVVEENHLNKCANIR